MKTSIIKLICILITILIHTSCDNKKYCKKCKEKCTDCQVVVDTNDIDTSTILYTMDNQSVLNMLNTAPSGCAALCIVDIPVPGENHTEFVLVPVDASIRPIPHGNWMKGTRRCPPVCDVTLGVGPDPNPILLSPVTEDQKRVYVDQLSRVPQQVANSVVMTREMLIGFLPQDFMTVMVPDNNQSISIMIVKSMAENDGHERRVHISMH